MEIKPIVLIGLFISRRTQCGWPAARKGVGTKGRLSSLLKALRTGQTARARRAGQTVRMARVAKPSVAACELLFKSLRRVGTERQSQHAGRVLGLAE